MQLKNQKDFFSGLLFIGCGAAFAWSASHLPIGTAADMGAGYFPLLLGALLALLGGVVVFKALVFETEDGGRLGAWAWRPVAFMVLANGVFGVLVGGLASVGIAPMGLVLAVWVGALLASQAGHACRWKEAVALATVLAALSYAVALLLQSPVALWPVFAAH